MEQQQKKVSMRHLYLYTYLLLEEAKKMGRAVRLEWANIPTASIGPDPRNPKGLVLRLSHMASTGTEEDAVLLRALVAHEILCHGNHTDFSVRSAPGIHASLSNVIEDPRGELKALKSFPGSKKVIREGIEVLVNRGIFCGPKDDAHPASVLTGWLVTELRSELLGQGCLSDFSQQYRKQAIQLFGSRVVSLVKAEALKGAHANTTQEATDSAKRIIDILKMAPEEQKKQEESSPQQENQQPEEGQSSPDDESKDETGDDEPQNSPSQEDGDDNGGAGKQPGGNAGGSPSGDESGDASAGENGQGESSSESGEPFEPSAADLEKAIQAVLDASKDDTGRYGKGLEDVLCEGNEAMQQARGRSYSHEMPEVPAPLGASIETRAELRRKAKATTATLSIKMEELLASLSMVERKKGYSGRLSPSSVWRVPLGDVRVFKQRHREEERSTAVFLLGDESGSMDTQFDSTPLPLNEKGEEVPPLIITRADATGRAIVAVGDVLENAAIPFALATYDTNVREWKGFDDDWARSLARYHPAANGSTNTHLAVVWALRKFAERTEDRKVLIVVTDGDPGNEAVLNAALGEAALLGVEVRFVLISTQLEYYYREINAPYGAAESANQLAKAVFGALEAAVVY